ncbi:MAG: beta-propeller fold lactonase family protein [Verrucomicrobiae bacterium]|nr:beta-propeller fold lactonase family protein [Verrucomicrobiae bacterium]
MLGPLPIPRTARRLALARLILAGLLPALPQSATAQLMISGNENKIDLDSGAARTVPGANPDSLTLLDFSVFPPRVQHIDDIPNSVIGPPSNLAITPDNRHAIVADSLRLDPLDPSRWIPESTLRVVDLTLQPPRVVGEARAGSQPSGLSITPDGSRVLVANRADGTVSLLRLDGPHLSHLQTVPVAAPEDSVSDVAVHPNGRLVLASVQKGGYLAVLLLDGDTLRPTDRKVSVYGQPYRCVITPDGRLALTAGQGHGNGLDPDAMSVIDLTVDPIRTHDYVALGAVPESIEIHPRGHLVAAVLMNGSNLGPADPLRTANGSLVLLRRQGNRFTVVQEVLIGRIPEGVAFSPDGRHLVVQCHPDRELWIYRVRGHRLRDTGIRIPTPGMPSSLRAGR